MFEESIDKEDEWEMYWAKEAQDRHYRYFGFKIYTVFDIEKNKWFKSIYFQLYKLIDKEIFRWNIKKGLW